MWKFFSLEKNSQCCHICLKNGNVVKLLKLFLVSKISQWFNRKTKEGNGYKSKLKLKTFNYPEFDFVKIYVENWKPLNRCAFVILIVLQSHSEFTTFTTSDSYCSRNSVRDGRFWRLANKCVPWDDRRIAEAKDYFKLIYQKVNQILGLKTRIPFASRECSSRRELQKEIRFKSIFCSWSSHIRKNTNLNQEMIKLCFTFSLHARATPQSLENMKNWDTQAIETKVGHNSRQLNLTS